MTGLHLGVSSLFTNVGISSHLFHICTLFLSMAHSMSICHAFKHTSVISCLFRLQDPIAHQCMDGDGRRASRSSVSFCFRQQWQLSIQHGHFFSKTCTHAAIQTHADDVCVLQHANELWTTFNCFVSISLHPGGSSSWTQVVVGLNVLCNGPCNNDVFYYCKLVYTNVLCICQPKYASKGQFSIEHLRFRNARQEAIVARKWHKTMTSLLFDFKDCAI